MGYYRAGFAVYGIDNKPQPHYPFPFLLMDALEAMDRLLRGEGLAFSNGETLYLADFVAYHASPPCQRYSTATSEASKHPDLYAVTREMLKKTVPFVIENVINAPYDHGIILCGSMFNLNYDGEWLQRHRNFETSWLMFQPICCHKSGQRTITITGKAFVAETREYKHSRQTTFEIGKKLMGIDWMNRSEIIEAIPPAYTEYIGKYLMQAVKGVK